MSTINQYIATSGQTVFTYTFEIFDKTDIAVTQDSVVLTEGTDYTVSGVGNDDGGNITLVSGATTGDVITIYRDMELVRLNDYQQSGDFLAEEVNDDFDRLWLALGQERSNIQNAIRGSIDDPVLNSGNTILPPPAARASRFIAFDSDGRLTFPLATSDGTPSNPEQQYETPVYLSTYVETNDTTLDQAWDRYLAAVDSGLAQRFIVIDPNPNDANGNWEKKVPSQLRSGMHVKQAGDFVIDWTNTDTSAVYRRQRGMFEAIGELESAQTTVTGDISEGDDYIDVSSAVGFSVGDFIDFALAVDGNNSDNYSPELYFVFKIVNIDSNRLYIDALMEWPVNVTTESFTENRVQKVTVVENVTVEGLRFTDTSAFVNYVDKVGQAQPDYVIGPLYFQYVHNIYCSNIRGNRMKCPLIQTREFNNVHVERIYLDTPDCYGPGEGYGVQWSRGLYATGRELHAQNERHVFDFTGTWHGLIDGAYSPRTLGTATFLQHGRFESNITLRRLVGDTWSFGAGFTFGNWSKKLSMFDCDIREILIGGRGTLSWFCKNCRFTTLEGRAYVDKLVWDNTILIADLFELSVETRVALSGGKITQQLDSGYYFSNGSVLAGGEIREVPRISFDDTCRFRYGGVLQRKMIFQDCPIVRVGQIRIERVEFQHQGEVGLVEYDGASWDMDFTEYTSFATAAIRFSGMSAPTDFDKPNIRIKNCFFRLNNASGPRPVQIQRGSTAGSFEFNLELIGNSWENNVSTCAIDEDATFFATGVISNNICDTGGIRVNDTDAGGLARNPIPDRILVGPNQWLNGAVDYDNYLPTKEQLTIVNSTNPQTLSTTGGAINLAFTGYTLTNNINDASLSTTDLTLPAGDYDIELHMVASKSDGSSGQLVGDFEIEFISGDTKTIPLNSCRVGLVSSGASSSESSSTRSFTLSGESVMNINADCSTNTSILASGTIGKTFYLEVNKVG